MLFELMSMCGTNKINYFNQDYEVSPIRWQFYNTRVKNHKMNALENVKG